VSKSRRSTLIRGTVSLALLLFLASSVDWSEIGSLLQATAWPPLAFAIVLIAGLVGLSALKWRLLLTMHRVSITMGDAFRLYWIGIFFSNFLPSSIGGDAVRVALLHNTHNLTTVAATVVEERATGFLVLVALSTGALIWGPQYPPYLALPLWSGVMVAAGLLTALLFLPALSIPLPIKRIMDHLPGVLARVLNAVTRVARATTALHRDPRSLATTLFLSCIYYLGIVLVQYAIFRGCGVPIAFLDILWIAPLTLLIGAIPISLNGIGLVEGAFVLLYGYVGVTPEQAFTAALLNRFMGLGVSLVGAPFWTVYKNPVGIAPAAASDQPPEGALTEPAGNTLHNEVGDTDG